MNITDIKKNQSVRDVHEIAKELRPIIDNEVKKQCAELDKIVASIPRDINSIETNEISAKALALQIGGEVSFNALGRMLGLNSLTVQRYMDLLEKSQKKARLS